MQKHDYEVFNFVSEAVNAQKRIGKYIRQTPLEYSFYLSKIGNCNVYLKLENLQETGSFKIRGAANHILSLSEKKLAAGIITASTGNHAHAVAKVLSIINANGTIYVPEKASNTKLESLQNYGVHIEYFGKDIIETELFARQKSEKCGQTYIPPYNHKQVIAGQATIAIEIEKQLENIDAVFVPVGGGGLASGIAGYLKQKNKEIKIIGCQPENSPIMFESVKAGKIVDKVSLPTIADGSAGGIEEGSLTFGFCKKYVDDYILVSENEIINAIKIILEKHHFIIEGAAALSVAGYIKTAKSYQNRNIVLVISGNKISMETLRSIICSNSEY